MTTAHRRRRVSSRQHTSNQQVNQSTTQMPTPTVSPFASSPAHQPVQRPIQRSRYVSSRSRKATHVTNWPLIAIGLAGGLAILFIAINYLSPQERYYRQQQAIARQEEADFQLKQQRLKNEAIEGNQRYREACTMPAQPIDNGRFRVMAISVDAFYIDNQTNALIAPGEVLCDDNGVSGIVGAGGKIQAETIRRASDPNLYNQRFYDAWGWNKNVLRSNTIQ